MAAFVGHQEKIAEKASDLELQCFTPILNHIEETLGPVPQPPSSPASTSEQEGTGESTGFDHDSEDKSDDEERRKKTEPLSMTMT